MNTLLPEKVTLYLWNVAPVTIQPSLQFLCINTHIIPFRCVLCCVVFFSCRNIICLFFISSNYLSICMLQNYVYRVEISHITCMYNLSWLSSSRIEIGSLVTLYGSKIKYLLKKNIEMLGETGTIVWLGEYSLL